MKRLVSWSIDNRVLVLIGTAALFFMSLWALANIKLDAIPDLSDTQVIVEVKYPGQPPQIVEDQVTYPMTTRMLSVPFAKTVRGYSFFGFSLVYILFEDGTDLYWARSRILEYLNSMQGKLPQGVSTELGPDATGVGWVYEYALIDETGKMSLADLRDLQDFVLRYELTALPGIAEVASLGGFRRQFQVEINPDLLLQYDIRISDLEMAIKKANMEMGARLFQQAEKEFMVLAHGYVQNVEDLKKIPIRSNEQGSVLRLGDVSHISEGPDIRRGLADLNGTGEVVGAIVVMRQGEDVPRVIVGVKDKLAKIQKSLPKGVKIVPTYDRSEIINEAVSNLRFKLIEELIVVSIITLIFLLHVRSALVSLIVLPLGVLFTFLFMHLLGKTANIMSMGGIAIAVGVMIDSSVVMVENTHKHLEKLRSLHPELTSDLYWQAAREAVSEVAPGLFWSMVIIVISFTPVFALPEQSGRLFIPLALTKTLAMTAAAILAVMLMPILVGYFIRGDIRPESKHPVSVRLIKYYEPILTWSLDNKRKVIFVSVIFLLFSLIPIFGIPNPFSKNPILKGIGSEFMPPLEEGDILYMPTSIPGISVAKAKEIIVTTDRLIKTVPEVKTVFGKIGRADSATDPAPLTMVETNILLKDKSEWRDGITMDDIIEELDRKVKLPGLVNAWTMPIKTRIDMLSTGIKTPLGLKVMGEDLKVLQNIAEQLEGHLSAIEGVSSVFGERTEGGNYMIYDIDREKAGLYGLNIADIQNVLSRAVGGMKVTDIIKGPYRWSANLRYLRSYRESIEKLSNIYIPLPKPRNGQIPISAVATLKIEKGPAAIKTENARKTSWLYVDTRESDIGSLAEKIQKTVDKLIVEKKIEWPIGYSYLLSGQFEQMKLAGDRMKMLIPLVILLVFVILFIHFKNSTHPIWVMSTALLFAPLGGLWFMFLSDYNNSVASDVGFIALIGLASETGVLMLVYLDEALKEIKSRIIEKPALRKAVIHGAVMRVRPKVMTVATTMIGLVPLFWGNEPGNVAMRRIAAPMLGGLITSTVVTLILLPVIFEWWYQKKPERNIIEEV